MLVRTVVGAVSARSAVGQESASTVVCALHARSAVGHKSASTVVSAINARSAAGVHSASTVVGAINARSAVGHKYASTVVGALSARSAVGHQYASTVVTATGAKIATRRNSSFIIPKGSRATAGYRYSSRRSPGSSGSRCFVVASLGPHHSHHGAGNRTTPTAAHPSARAIRRSR